MYGNNLDNRRYKNIKTITIDQFLTSAEIEKARKLYTELKDTGSFAQTIEEEIITPNIERINQALGQENHPGYLAYVIEYVMMKGGNSIA